MPHVLHVYHSSLINFLHDPERSGLLSVPSHHHYEDGLQAIVRILSQAIKSGQLDSTSISLSWPSLQLGADNPHSLTLLVAALQSFFKFFDEATSLQPIRREVQLQIAHLLEHLDLAEAFSMIGTSVFWKRAYQGFRKFLDDPRNHALANVRAIRVNEIDFSKISQERLCYVFPDVRGPKEFSLPMRPRGFNTIGRVVGNSDLEIGMKEKFLICYASNPIHIDGMRQVLPDLRSLPGDEPSAPICTWGIGEQRKVIFERRFIVDTILEAHNNSESARALACLTMLVEVVMVAFVSPALYLGVSEGGRSAQNPLSLETPVSGTFFPHAHHFRVENPVLVGQQVINNFHRSGMEKLALYTIHGAAFNSSARDPPPRCHPQTRTAILERVHNFLSSPNPPRRIFWLCGPAGVGKSAIIQTVAESISSSTQPLSYRLGATLFFSKPNDRDDPKRVFTTMAYQLATRYPAYRDYIVSQLVDDPLLGQSSMAEQFRLLLAVPFAERQIHQSSSSLVVLLDGLDECKTDREQVEIVMLISQFIVKHPEAPILWVIASRPEPHIRNAFSRQRVLPTFLKESIPIDSDEACGDVERYLRNSFDEICENYPECFPPQAQWPSEKKFLKLCAIASGHFALAATVVRFVEDPDCGNPVARFEEALAAVARPSLSQIRDTNNPLATLDALYTRIFSAIPKDVLPSTIRMIAFFGWASCSHNLRVLANFWGLDQGSAYSAMRRLHAVLVVPSPESVDQDDLRIHHRTFTDFLQAPGRLKSLCFTYDHHADGLRASIRVLGQSVSTSNLTPENISLSWPSLREEVDLQRKTQLHALQLLFWCFNETTEPTRREVQPCLKHVLEHLDLVDACALTKTHSFQTFFLVFASDQQFLDDSKNRPIANARAVRVDELDFSHFDMEKWCYIHLREEAPDAPRTDKRGLNPLKSDSAWSEDENGQEERTEILYSIAMEPLKAEGMKQVLLDLRSLPIDEPTAPVWLWGFGEKRKVIFIRHFLVGSVIQECHYVAPYPDSF
ncbi:hypothetical protein NP233_g12094 [Leucocoprinus birnbaumii]|uniref:NACHT domain-containing protein n=1 Tax=Leucocoprinus birnbaumii TaxID=56174 RepID=A0AAD5VF15_9AGAR|nr:hypothetical protein NP233_g12094 [Leucocoprinus birnbaumii]